MTRGLRMLAASVVLVAVWLAAALPASASIAARPFASDVLFVTGDPGESNDFSVSLSGSTYTITDSLNEFHDPEDCTLTPDKHTATCPAHPADTVLVLADDGDDRVAINGPIDTAVCGGPG